MQFIENQITNEDLNWIFFSMTAGRLFGHVLRNKHFVFSVLKLAFNM